MDPRNEGLVTGAPPRGDASSDRGPVKRGEKGKSHPGARNPASGRSGSLLGTWEEEFYFKSTEVAPRIAMLFGSWR
jgi:hypothetical protein